MYLVFDVGGTFVKYGWMTAEGEILEKGKFPTNARVKIEPEEFVEKIGKVYDEFKKKGEVEGIAMDLPGQIDIENGIVHGGGALPYLDKAPVGPMISKRCDNVRVSLENDGKCAALAEVWLGNAKDVQNAVVMVIGTGIGGGVIVNRRVLHGSRMIAGELSYMLDNMDRHQLDGLGSVKEMSSLDEIYRKYSFFLSASASTCSTCYKAARLMDMPIEDMTGEMMYEIAASGNEEMQELLEDFYFSIAKSCINLYAILDPDVILIGGGISAEPKFVEGIKKYVEKIKATDPIYRGLKIDTCKFQNDSNLYGSLYNFKQMYEGVE